MSNSATAPRVLLFGSKWLGAVVLTDLVAEGFEVALLTDDATNAAARAAFEAGLPWSALPDADALTAPDFRWRPDLCVSAHSFRILPPWLLRWSRFGAIGYHPSLLPDLPGRHAVRDAVEGGRTKTGGTVYWLTPQIDGGPVVALHGRAQQEEVAILADDTPAMLWRRSLAPLGRRLLSEAVKGVFKGSGNRLI